MKSVSFSLIAFMLPILAQPVRQSLYPNQYPIQYPSQYANQYTSQYSYSYNSPVLKSSSSPAAAASTKDVDDRMYFPWFWINSYVNDDDRSNIGAAVLQDQLASNTPASGQKTSLAGTQPKAFQSDNRDFRAEQSPIQPDGQNNIYTSQSSDTTFLPNGNKQENWVVDPPGAFGESVNQDNIESPSANFASTPDAGNSAQLSQPSSSDSQSNIGQQPSQIDAGSSSGYFGIQGTSAGDDSFLDGPKNPASFIPSDKKSDTCNMRYYRYLIGSTYNKKYNYFTIYQFKFNQNILPSGSRIIGPNTPVTMDLRPSRLNVIYKQDPITKQNKVVKLACY